jgi:outer membrane receptor protein involved in Fe transport
VPIVDDKVALRLVGNYNRFAGYVDNVRLNLKDVNDGDSYGGRALLRLTPTDRLTLDAAVYYEKVATDSSRWIFETGQRYATNGRAESGNYDENRIYSGTAHYDFDAMSLTAVTTYFDRDRIAVGDVSDTFIGRDNAAGCARYRNRNAACSPEVLADYLEDTRRLFASSLYQPQSVKNWTNEIRLSSIGDGPFNWTVGVYSEDRETVVRSTLLVANPATGELLDFRDPANLGYDRTIFDFLKQKAAFAEASYEMLDGLTFTAGTRYYEYKKRVGGQIDLGQEHYSSVVTPYQEARSKEDGFIYKFNLSWEASSDLLLYAQAAQGFRPGGVNQVIGLPAALAAYTSDSLWNYEAGVKSTLTRGVYLNVAAYRIDWDDLQVSARTAGTGSVFGLIANAGAAKIEGVEVEFSATPVDGLSIGTNLGYTNARLSEDQVSTVVTATGRKGDRLAFVPKWSLSGSAEYTWPVGTAVEGLARLDVAHTGSSYSTLSRVDSFRRKVDGYEIANLRAGVQSPDGDWGAYLFVNNLFDAAAINSKSSSSNTGGLTLTYSAPPRTYGINVLRRF